MIDVGIKREPHGVGLPLPRYQSDGAAGFDLPCALPAGRHYYLNAGERVIVPTGFSFEIPFGYQLEIRSRSGLAGKSGLAVLNAPGTIDHDYRGEIFVTLTYVSDVLVTYPECPNASEWQSVAWTGVERRLVQSDAFFFTRGDRVAQAVLMPVAQANLIERVELEATARGARGLGSTGVSA